MAADGQRHSPKIERIKEIRKAGCEPRIDIMRHGIDNERDAFMVEAVLIDCLGIENLTNKPRGHGAERGRRTLNELVSQFGARPVSESAPPAVLFLLKHWQDEEMEIERGYFRSGYGYKQGMAHTDLADSVRAWWDISKLSVESLGVKYAAAVHGGVTRGVFEIGDEWIEKQELRSTGKWVRLRAFNVTPLEPEGPVYEAWVGQLGRRVDIRSYGSSFMYWPR